MPLDGGNVGGNPRQPPSAAVSPVRSYFVCCLTDHLIERQGGAAVEYGEILKRGATGLPLESSS
ncbi:MAG: hypothetical protein LUE61_03250, partial [Clostridiales bacterium]|nr:hypothetical protein [Clostridiales bacterium]